MSRLQKKERQLQLQEELNKKPFLTDEELASCLGASVPTIRLDRLELGIPELRARIKNMATEHANEGLEAYRAEHVGNLIDLTVGKYGISMLDTTEEMTDYTGYVQPEYLYAQANALAKAVIDVPVALTGLGNIKHKNLVKAKRTLIAKAEVIRKRGNKYFVWVFTKDKDREVFRAKFIMESVENKV